MSNFSDWKTLLVVLKSQCVAMKSSDLSFSFIRNCVICVQCGPSCFLFSPFLYCRVWTISSYLQTHFLPLWWFISGDVIKLLNLHSFLWNIGRNVKSAREPRMNGRIAISVVERFTQWMQRAWCQQPCVCTTKQSADIGNDGGGTLQYTRCVCTKRR